MILDVIKNKIEQKCKTSNYPKEKIVLPENYRGMPLIKNGCSDDIVRECAENCPVDAIDSTKRTIDLGKCLFCGDCEKISNSEFVEFTGNYETGVSSREDLIVGVNTKKIELSTNAVFKKLFGRSLQLRVVSAGGCNACEADINVLNTPFYDLARFGIQFVASPRHADGLLVIGPVPVNMELALKKSYNAIPDPKVVIASGCCAISGGIFKNNPEQLKGVDEILDVDLYIPGCPPHPMTALSALLRFFTNKLQSSKA